MRSWGVTCVLLTLGCGGVSQRDGLPDKSDARGGAGAFDAGNGGSADTFDAGNGGVAGAVSVGESGAPGAAGSLCSARPLGCDTSATYVDVSDTTTVRLAYAADASATKGNEACQIVATGSSGCGFLNLSLSACSAPNGAGVCLDTASAEPHYTDASGKRWTMLDLSGSSSQPNVAQAQGMADLDLTLALGSESTYHELAVHMHVCADISAVLKPCK
jgi:hypothetical protein